MTMYHEFNHEEVNAALDAIKAHGAMAHEVSTSMAPAQAAQFAGGEFSVSGGCISVTVGNHQICLNLPIVGKHCIPVPVNLPNGTAAQACLSICTTWGIPTGVKVTISVAGHVIVTKSFGKC